MAETPAGGIQPPTPPAATSDAKSELDQELEKVGATVAKIGNGILTFAAKVGGNLAPAFEAILTNVLTAIGTNLATKTLNKYGIKV